MRSRCMRTVLAWRPRRSASWGRTERARRAGQLAIEQVARLVAERLEHREGIHLGLTVPGTGHIFNPQVFYWSSGAAPDPRPTGTVEPDGEPPDARRSRGAGHLGGVRDPELGASIVDLGMLRDVEVSPDGDVRVKVALTTAGCPLRGQIKADVISKVHGLAGVRDVTVEYAEMTQAERSAVMQRARLEASQPRARHRDLRDDARHRGRERQGRRRQVVGDGEPRDRARGAGPRGRRARRRHLGLQRPAHARCRRVAWRVREGRSTSRARARSSPPRSRWRTSTIRPVRPVASRSCRWGCSSTTRTPRSCGAASSCRRRSSSSSPT